MDKTSDSNTPSDNNPQSESYTRTSNQGPLGSILGRIRGVFSNRTTAIAGVLVLVLGLGAGVIAVQRSTEYRQQAAWVPTKPSPPSLSFSTLCSGNISQVNLTWSTGVSAEVIEAGSGYRVYQWNTPVASKWNIIKDTTSKSFLYSPLSQGSGYTLRITAYNSAGESDPSNNVGFAAIKCPAGPTPTPIIAPNPNIDGDNDGFSNKIEGYAGTNPQIKCLTATTPGKPSSAWPADLTGDNLVNGTDILSFNTRIGAKAGDARYDKRYDLNADGIVNGADTLALNKYMSITCQKANVTPTPTKWPTPTPRPIYTPAPTKAPTPILPPAASQPPSPTGLTAVCTSGTSVTLKWSPVAGATYYNFSSNGPSGGLGWGVTTNSTSMNVTAGGTYTWSVTACTSTACSAKATGPSFKCGTP